MEQLVNLKQLRQELKLTQTAAAEGIGIDQRQWNRYENGKNELPVRYLRAICITYQVSADWLLGITKERQIKYDKRN
ncbi:MAG: helix-turn-helix transcriptional regulator [Oscillospiraceae bacterium]|nr:helix-turn-helix transcriptional regulator [Oscillospiraceae bacterium]